MKDRSKIIVGVAVAALIFAAGSKGSPPPPRHAFPSKWRKVWICPLSAKPPHDPIVNRSVCIPERVPNR